MKPLEVVNLVGRSHTLTEREQESLDEHLVYWCVDLGRVRGVCAVPCPEAKTTIIVHGSILENSGWYSLCFSAGDPPIVAVQLKDPQKYLALRCWR